MNLPVLLMVVTSNYQYDDHSIAVVGKRSSFILENNSGWIPAPQENYEVQNIGRVDVTAQLWYGDEAFAWWGIVTETTLKPGEVKILDNGGKIYYYTGLFIINNNSTRAIVHATGGELYNPCVPPKINYMLWLRRIAYFALKRIPYGKNFSKLLNLFWPHKQPNVWQNVTQNISPLLEKQELQIIQSILGNEVLYYKDQIASLQDELKDNNKTREHYMNIAYSLVGFELKFVMPNTFEDHNTVNFYILPLYTNAVSMKMHFYTIGIQQKDQIGLMDDDVSNIQKYMNRTVAHSSEYINSMLKWPVDNAYNTSTAEGIFDNMMTVRSHLALHGEEYLPFWNHMMNNPLANDTDVYNHVISYSDFFGRATANLYAQATPEEVPEPLNPRLIKGKRNKLINIRVYLWDLEMTAVSGMRLEFSSQDIYQLGTVTEKFAEFDLRDTYIEKLIAFGEGEIDGLKFFLEDGRTFMFGTVTSKTFKTFEMPNHHIVSLYMSSDYKTLHNKAANIAVSYLWKN
nr:uncharacterized protein LOC111508756 [Leptinotarsa decemlineata]